ncbi:MAG: efflux RND transporter periplasmic adaptor subunit [Desulfobacterales bacterium]|nr:efflux RND transporter periplasmic adaptor subunit [Desulfobacterales bacterium]
MKPLNFLHMLLIASWLLFPAGPSHGASQKDPHAGHGQPVAEKKKEAAKKPMPAVVPSNTITVTPERQQLIGVKTGTVITKYLRKIITTTGRVDYDERKVVIIAPKVGGWIEELYVNFIGAFVKAGAPLLTIYSPELVSTQEEYIVALRARKDLVKSLFPEVAESGNSIADSSLRRLKFWDISEEQIQRLEESGQVKKTLTLYSPYDGFVLETMAYKGLFVTPGAALFKLADISTLWIHADIYEYELPLIRLGQKANVRLSYLPGEVFVGKAIYIYPSLDPKTRTAKVRFEFDNRNLSLKPEMYADVDISIDLGRKVAIPEDAIIDTGRRQVVFIDKGSGVFEAREVKIGVKAEEHYEVITGVRPGERVVTSANFLIDSESKFKEAIEKMTGQGHVGHGR